MSRPLSIFVVLLATFRPLGGADNPARIFFRDAKHPVVSGEAWLIANRWGAYQAVLVGTIRDAEFTRREKVEFPQYWEQADDYKFLLAVSDRAVEAPSSFETDGAYGWAGHWPEYLKQFHTIYLSDPLPRENLGKDWDTALQRLGHFTESNLVLPRPSRRTVRFLYPDGKPLARERLWVSLFGSRANHCGMAVGIPLGEFVTNTEGEISVIAPNSSLAVTALYFEEMPGGPAGAAFASFLDLVVGGEQEITVKRLWNLPEHDYVLNLRTAENQPIAHARLEGCMFQPPCMGECGPIRAPESNGLGVIRFRERDLRELRSVTIINAQGSKRDLTDSEMRELLTTFRLNVTWR